MPNTETPGGAGSTSPTIDQIGQTGDPRTAELRDLDRTIADLWGARERDRLKLALKLAEARDRGLYELHGYLGLGRYAEERHHIPRRTTTRLISIATWLRSLPPELAPRALQLGYGACELLSTVCRQGRDPLAAIRRAEVGGWNQVSLREALRGPAGAKTEIVMWRLSLPAAAHQRLHELVELGERALRLRHQDRYVAVLEALQTMEPRWQEELRRPAPATAATTRPSTEEE